MTNLPYARSARACLAAGALTLGALIAELRYYEYRMTAAGNVKLGAPDRAGATDDLTTALALALKGGQRSGRAGVWLLHVGGEMGF